MVLSVLWPAGHDMMCVTQGGAGRLTGITICKVWSRQGGEEEHRWGEYQPTEQHLPANNKQESCPAWRGGVSQCYSRTGQNKIIETPTYSTESGWDIP